MCEGLTKEGWPLIQGQATIGEVVAVLSEGAESVVLV